MDEIRWNLLPKELKVLIEIQRLQSVNNSSDYRTLNTNLISKGIKVSEIHNAIDNLIDTGNINEKWIKIETDWIREYTINEFGNELILAFLKKSNI